jgi:nitrogen fixation NifU-like protein
MAALDALYQQLILDHARERHGAGLRPMPPDAAVGESRQFNPTCGDEVTLRLAVRGQRPGRQIADLCWDGAGCSISEAATSVLHDLVLGRPVSEALAVLDAYRHLLRSRGTAEPDETVLGDAVAFAGVGRHATRVKCAMLGWTALEDALFRAGDSAGEALDQGDAG